MKLRKALSIMLCLTLLAGVMLLAGCSQAAGSGKVKVGVIYINPTNDGGWSEAHAKGFKAAIEAIGADKVELKEMASIPDNDAQKTETALKQLAEEGCQIIFATSYGYMETVAKVAKEYPNIKFEHCSGSMKADNLANYFGQIEQPRYLSGIVAGMMTKSNKIGYVAAQQIAECVRGINAFTLGVRSVNPNAEVQVVWTNTWYDPQKEKEAAISLIDAGCDVLTQHQDSTAVQQAAQEKGVFGIGYDNPMYSDAIKDAYLTAPVWQWAAYYQSRIQAVIDGKWTTGEYWGGMKEGIVGLDTMTSLVPSDVQTKVNSLVDTMKSKGNDFVFAGPIKDNTGKERVAAGASLDKAAQMSMDWFVEGVVVSGK
ncbi:MAG: BMP family ABC transporter substrate-binding protein [Clostridiaceae bacterium]|nr:BMP family ABC transporter substrate-binding protein [Clostridiaceae bacterium]